MSSVRHVDSVDRHLIEALRANARATYAELARRVGLSAPAVHERVGKLEAAGVITGYHAEVDPRALGFELTALVRIRPIPRQLHKIPELARDTPEVVECHRITGEDCFLLKVHVPSIAALESVLDQFLLHGQTTSSFIVSTPVSPRPPVPSPPTPEAWPR